MPCTCSGTEPSSLQGAIKILQGGLLNPDEELLYLDVRRSCLVPDAMREACKGKFDTKKYIKVCDLYPFNITLTD